MRFYKEKFPNVGDVVMTQYVHVDELVVKVILPEYDNIEGCIPHAELSRKKIMFVQRQVKINSLEPAIVTYLDVKKGYMDLSKKIVSHEQAEECKERFRKNKFINTVIQAVARKEGINVEDIYEKCIFIIDGDAYSILVNGSSQSSSEIFKSVEEEFKRRINIGENVKLSSVIKVTCFSEGGIDSVKESLLCGKIEGVRINLIFSPYYCISLLTNDKSGGEKIIEKSISLIKDKILSLGGDFEIVKNILYNKNDSEIEQDIERERNNSDLDE